MNIGEVREAFRQELRSVAGEDETIELLPHLTRRSWMNGQVNEVNAFALTEETVADAIQGEIAHFQVLNRTFEWKAFSFDEPPNLVDHLRAAEFAVGEREAMVIYDLRDGLAPFVGSLPSDVRRVRTLEQLTDFRSVAEAVFEKDYTFTTEQLAEAIRAEIPGHDAYVAYEDGEPVAVGRIYTDPRSQFAGFYGGGVRREYRGRGHYRAIMAARAHQAAEFGSRYLLVDALPTSLPILLRMGFVQVGETWPCTFG